MNVCILGASGLVGGHCLRLVLEQPEIQNVLTWTRRLLPIEHSKLKQIIVDFSSLQTYANHLKDVNTIFCCLGTTMKQAGSKATFYQVDYTYPVQIAEMAKTAGVQHVSLVSSLGADPRSSIYYSQVKGQTEQAVQALGLPSVHIFRPSILLGKRESRRLGEEMVGVMAPALSLILQGPLRKYRPIAAKTVAQAMVCAANRSQLGCNIYESDSIEKLVKL